METNNNQINLDSLGAAIVQRADVTAVTLDSPRRMFWRIARDNPVEVTPLVDGPHTVDSPLLDGFTPGSVLGNHSDMMRQIWESALALPNLQAYEIKGILAKLLALNDTATDLRLDKNNA